jgi:hypothetical protein
MATIRPATHADLDAVVTFLAAELGGAGGAARYRHYLGYTWLADKPDLGMLIEDEGQVRGFVGAIYSARRHGSEVLQLCNLTSVAVAPDYRKHTLQLFGALFKRKELTFTCFSASPEVQKILGFFKFQHRPADKVIVAPISGLRGLRSLRRVRVITGADALDAELDDVERAIARDHRGYRCGELLITDGNARCFVVAVRRGRDIRRFADVLYASDPQMLLEHLPWIHAPLFRSLGTVLTGIDRRWIRHAPPRPSVVYTNLRPVYARSQTLDVDQVDGLYSELVASSDR